MKGFTAVIGTLMLVATLAPVLPAQAVADRTPAGPTIESARAGIIAPTAPSRVTPENAQVQAPSRESAALMIVGGAALLAGLVIGGGAGTALALGGAFVGLYGLWIYVS